MVKFSLICTQLVYLSWLLPLLSLSLIAHNTRCVLDMETLKVQFARPEHLKISTSCPLVAKPNVRLFMYVLIYIHRYQYMYMFIYVCLHGLLWGWRHRRRRCCSNFVFAHSVVNRFVCQSDNPGPDPDPDLYSYPYETRQSLSRQRRDRCRCPAGECVYSYMASHVQRIIIYQSAAAIRSLTTRQRQRKGQRQRQPDTAKAVQAPPPLSTHTERKDQL